MGRNPLGRGLEALISSSAPNDDSTVREIPLDHIRPNPYQPRKEFAPDALAELAQSIGAFGVLQPVILRRTGVDQYELVAGERRVRAARAAGLKAVPALIRDYAAMERLEVALIENLQRQDINAVEAAGAYARLRDEFGLMQEQIAARVGKSPSAVANTLRLLSLPDNVLEAIRRGEITEGHGRAILQAPPVERAAALENVRKRGLSVRETERLTRELRTESDRRKPSRPKSKLDPKDAHDAAIEEGLRTALGTKVTLRRFDGFGRLEVDFYSEDELEGIIQRIIGE